LADLQMPVTSKPAVLRIAVIGGGITGAVAASRISENLSHVSRELFDQGRRGPGGRASHRRVCDGEVLPDDLPAPPCCYEFDHGCQVFFPFHNDPTIASFERGSSFVPILTK
jgi:predicted NAD/FAD-dependent oxidoreductase